MARLSRPDEGEEDVAIAETAEDENDDAGRSDEAVADLAIETEAEAAIPLARIAFRDGEYFEFLAVPSDGEIGLAYIGEDARRRSALDDELFSPLRLYCSLTPPDAPLPWLLAVVDKQPDRAALVGNRYLCDSVEEVLLSESDTVRLRVPSLPGGWWTPDDLQIVGYCGSDGTHKWGLDFCIAELHPGPLLFPNIWKCDALLNVELTHNSIRGGTWRRRRTSRANFAPCESPTRVTHQYRKLTYQFPLLKWKWITATSHVVGPAPAVQRTYWLGIVRRRRRIIYKREGAIGGFRALSRFAQTLFD